MGDDGVTFTTRLEEIASKGNDAKERLHSMFDLWWEHEMGEFPERATSVGWPGHNDRWTDLSREAIERRKRDVAAMREAVDRIERSSLDDEDELNLELFRWDLDARAAGDRFPSELLVLSKMTGPHQTVPRVMSLAPARTPDDLADAVARLRAVPDLLEQSADLLRDGVERGVTQPRVAVADIAGQLESLAADSPATSPLLIPFKKRPDGVTTAEFDEERADAASVVAEIVQPALKRFESFVAGEYVPACRESIAMADMPDGDEWYRHAVRVFTTTSLTPDEIHEIGQSEVARIRSEMERVIDSTGHSGSFEAFAETLRTDDRFYYSDANDLLVGYRDIAKRIDAELPKLFGVLPRLPYGVAPVPDHEAPSTTTAYYLRGSTEAGRPGWFMANTYDLRSRPKWEMEALTAHEAVPGHHLQIALAAEIQGLPRFRRTTLGFTAFVEGWGLYAESLGAEMGLYEDPYSRFGQLTYEMWRAVRLVVDTGMHAMGWTRDQAIDFFRSNSSKPIHDITVEIDRYISWPGQALAYKLGEMTFKRLRARSAEALGPGFDVRSFHDVVLGAGALPLDLLERRVERWLDSGR